MPIALPVDDFVTGEYVPDYSSPERIGAAFDLARQDTFTSTQGLDFWGLLDPEYAFGRDDLLDKLAAGDKIGVMDPEKLNEMFPHVEKPFDKPTSFLVADHLNKEGKKRAELMDIISNGGSASGASTMGYSLLGGLVASATDPVEASVDVVLSAVTFGAAGIASKGAKAARLARKASAFSKLNGARKILSGHRLGRLGRFGKEAVEGVIANAALEPILMDSAQRAQQDYDMFDASVSVLGGGLGLPTLKHGTMALGRYTMNNLGGTNKALSTAVSHLKAGKRWDNVVNHVEESLKARINSVDRSQLETGSIRAEYEIKKVRTSDIPATKFYAAGLRPGKFNPESHHILGDYHGDGLHLSDNPNVANNTTQLVENGHTGDVHQLDLEEMNLLDLDEPTIGDIGNSIREVVPDNLKEVYDSGGSLKESLDNVKRAMSQLQDTVDDAEIFNDINGRMQELGIEGYHYHESDSGNYAYIFSPDKVKLSETFRSDPKGIPKNAVKGEEALRADVASDSSDILHKDYVEQEKIEIEKFQKEKQKTVDSIPENNKAYLDEVLNDFDEMKETGVYADDMKGTLEDIKLAREIDEIEDNAIKRYMNCLLGGRS